MLHEYIITAFKVIVGVITNNRLVLAGLIALGILILWVFFSLIFSFQKKFCSNVKRINNYVSRNGISGDAKSGLDQLISKMPSEFQKGYRKFERNPNTLPSENIKRFESLEMEISGGVFNQNKSVIKTYINSIFVTLLVFSLAILSPEDALTGYNLAEATILPLIFFITAKITYYVYTAIRQFQYKAAIEEFNYMLENLDKAAGDIVGAENSTLIKNTQSTNNESNAVEKVENLEGSLVGDVNVSENQNNSVSENQVKSVSLAEIEALKRQMRDVFHNEEDIEIQKHDEVEQEDNSQVDSVVESFDVNMEPVEEEKPAFTFDFNEDLNDEDKQQLEDEIKYVAKEIIENQEEFDEEIKETNIEPEKSVVGDIQEKDLDEYISKEEISVQEDLQDVTEKDENQKENQQAEMDIVDENINKEYKDNFKPDFSSLLEEEEVETVVKRGRGRPKKEVSDTGEFIIKNDKEFEEALVRAEKLMRKNEEPLSASQTKRIEKQIKELVDAMTKYKEGK